jgi:hypothetical protein
MNAQAFEQVGNLRRGLVNEFGPQLFVGNAVKHKLTSQQKAKTGVPMNLISGHPYWFTAAMNGEFGPVVAALWNFYVIGIYTIAHDLWIVALGCMVCWRRWRAEQLVAGLFPL